MDILKLAAVDLLDSRAPVVEIALMDKVDPWNSATESTRTDESTWSRHGLALMDKVDIIKTFYEILLVEVQEQMRQHGQGMDYLS